MRVDGGRQKLPQKIDYGIMFMFIVYMFTQIQRIEIVNAAFINSYACYDSKNYSIQLRCVTFCPKTLDRIT